MTRIMTRHNLFKQMMSTDVENSVCLNMVNEVFVIQ